MSDSATSLEDALTRYFEAVEAGHSVDLESICGGDRRLEERLRAVLDRQPQILSELGRSVSESDREVDESGRVVGDFQILREVGRGGMGTVFLAEQRSLRRIVALKILDKAVMRDRTARLRFERESLLTAALDHPNIVPVYAVGEEHGEPFLAMKFLRGPSLGQLPDAPPVEDAVRWFRDVARALDAAHRAGVVHRDVKPENILLDDDRAYLVDFGLARGVHDHTLTRANAVPGTLSYLAPELLAKGESAAMLSPASDVYALGVSIVEVIARRPLFETTQPELLIACILDSDPEPVRLGRRYRSLELVVQKCLRKSPSARYASAAEVADDLERVLRSEPVLARKESRLERLVRRARRHPRSTAAWLVAIVVLGVTTGLLLDHRTSLESEWRDRVRFARLAFEDGRHEEVLDRLEGYDGPDSADVALLRRSSRQALISDRLLERCMGRSGLFVGEENRQLVDEAIGLGLRNRIPRGAAAMFALAAIHRDDEPEAREWIATLDSASGGSGPTRASLALRAVLGRGQRPAGLPSLDVDAGFEELIVSAVALMWSGASIEELRPELDRLTGIAPRDWRVGVLLVSTLLIEGRSSEAYRLLAAFEGGETLRPQFVRLRASCALRRRRFSEARQILSEIPFADWGGQEIYLDLETLRIEGRERNDLGEFDARLEELRPTHGETAEFQRMEAEGWLLRGRRDEALSKLESVQWTAPDRLTRELALVTAFEWTDDYDEGVRTARATARSSVVDREILARIDLRAVEVDLARGPHSRQLDWLRPWRRFRPVAVRVADLWLRVAVPELIEAGTPAGLPASRRAHFQTTEGRVELIEARAVVDWVLERWREGDVRAADVLLAQLVRAYFVLSVVLGDLEAIEETADWAIPRLESEEWRDLLGRYVDAVLSR